MKALKETQTKEEMGDPKAVTKAYTPKIDCNRQCGTLFSYF